MGRSLCDCNTCTGNFCAQKVPIFSMLTVEQLGNIANLIARKKVKNGELIFREGEVSDKFFIINEGKLKIYKYTKEGKEQILYILREGDFIGDLSLLKKSHFEFNAEALEDVSLCLLTKDDFDKIIRTNPDIIFKILENLHDRLVSMEKLVQTLSTKDVEARIAGLLVNLAKDFGTKEGGDILLDMALNREEMANYIGVTRETMSRKLSSMQDEDLIQLIGNKKILIKNLKYLQELSE